MESVTRGYGVLENFLSKQRTKIANSLLPPNKKEKILDIGCGTIPCFLMQVDFKERHGIDPNTKNKIYEGISLHRKDIKNGEKLPFRSNNFDVITMLAVVEHLDPKGVTKLLGETKRILKPGGRLIITTPAPASDSILKLMANVGVVSKTEIDDHKLLYSKEALLNCMREAGFKDIEFGYFEFLLNSWAYADK